MISMLQQDTDILSTQASQGKKVCEAAAPRGLCYGLIRAWRPDGLASKVLSRHLWTRAAVVMVQASINGDSIRSRLISLLPRLRRFASVLAGDRPGGDGLLRAACNTMLDEAHRYQRGTPFAR